MASAGKSDPHGDPLRILAGGMQAALVGPPDVVFTSDETAASDLEHWLGTRGVREGLDEEAIARVAAALRGGAPVTWPVYVAHGIPPRAASSGGLSVTLPSGTLVRAGQEVARVLPAGPPTPGKRVTGEQIPPPAKAPPPIRPGDGVQMQTHACVALFDGYLALHDNRVEVLSLFREAADRMSVDLVVRPVPDGSPRLTRGTIEEAAAARGYVGAPAWAAVEAALADLPARGTEGRLVRFLEGTPPKPGTPGRVEMVVDIGLAAATEVDADHVDFRERSAVKVVRAGDLLGRRVPPVPGTPGRDIFGQPLPPPPSPDATLQPGRNVQVRGGTEYFATEGGCVVVSNGQISVDQVFERDGDVDMTIGNISFLQGAVRVRGTVRDGFRVSAGSDLWVGGAVEDATLDAGVRVTVQGGVVQKGRGRVLARAGITIGYGERAFLECEGPVTVRKSAINCHVLAGGLIEVVEGRGVVRGGMFLSGERIRVKEVGTEAGVKTALCLYPITREVRSLESEYEDLRRKLEEVDHVVGEDREHVRATLATLAPERRAYMEKLLLAREMLEKRIDEVHAELLASIARWESVGRGTHRIDVLGMVHPGTTIEICGARLDVTATLTHVSFWLDAESREVKHGPLIERVYASEEGTRAAAVAAAEARRLPSRLLADLRARLDASYASISSGAAEPHTRTKTSRHGRMDGRT